MAVSVTDYTLIMSPKVKEFKSSQTHAICILSHLPCTLQLRFPNVKKANL